MTRLSANAARTSLISCWPESTRRLPMTALSSAMHAMTAGFKFQSGIRARALNFKIGFFYAAKFGFVIVQ